MISTPSHCILTEIPDATLCYAISLPGRKSGVRAGWKNLKIGPPAGRRPAGGPILRPSRLESNRNPAHRVRSTPSHCISTEVPDATIRRGSSIPVCVTNNRRANLYEFVGFGAVDVTNNFVWFGDIYGPKALFFFFSGFRRQGCLAVHLPL